MLNVEPCLLQAVTEAVRKVLDLQEPACNVEYDSDFVPQTSGDVYVSVSPEGFRVGPRHDSSGGIYDVVMGCRVSVYLRSRNTPRDQRRSLYLDQVIGVNSRLDKIIKAIDWQRSVIVRANAILTATEPTALGLMPGNPLRITSVDSKPRPIVGEVYGASTQSAAGADTYVGLTRGITFGGARRMELKT